MFLGQSVSALFPRLSYSRPRRHRNAACIVPSAVDCLENRRLLSGTNEPPELTILSSSEGMLEVSVSDDNFGAVLELEVDLDDDGTVDFVTDTFDGDVVVINLTNYVPPNSSIPVYVELNEVITTSTGQTVLTDSELVDVEGETLTATPFTWFAAADGIVEGAIDAESATGEVSLLYREVGDTAWTTLGELTGPFDFPVVEADGVKDFEFVTKTELSGVFVLGQIETVYDLGAFAGGEPGGPTGEPGDPGGDPGGESGGESGEPDDASESTSSYPDYTGSEDSDAFALFWSEFAI